MKNSYVYPSLGNLMKLSSAQTRSVSPENVYGEKGRGGMASNDGPQEEVLKIGQQWKYNRSVRELGGHKWKVRPYICLPAQSTTTIMDIEGPGIIQHIWLTIDDKAHRDVILRFYWDDEATPSVEVPLGDFFCNGWRQRTNIAALPICVNPSNGFNCYFPMPFRRRARVTVENRSFQDFPELFYSINYALTEVAEDDAYFHAQFRRVNPVPYGMDYTILDGVEGKGHYVGTFLAWQQNSAVWWGEGELKVYLDGDGEYPTICGTGTEDYFGGAWCFGQNYSTPFLGYPYGTSSTDWKGPSAAGQRHLLYRFHVMDPIRFHQDIKVDIQALGWRSEFRYLPLQDDISSVAYWYQAEPHGAFPALPVRQDLEII